MHEILVEESVIGWKEFELEVMRDVADNFVVICSIENIDPMGVHTGDSITVAPALTLTDKEYQRMRDIGRRIIRRVGVETGGSNIQFAVNPEDGRIVAIEMNPRVSRSSALASKATGFPIAKIAAKLALGYHLDEIPNDITRLTPASFEPTIDYIVVKFPRWNFEKFPQADRTLTTQMKSVGEAMAIGRTFKEAFLKAVRSLELGKRGTLFPTSPENGLDPDEDDTALRKRLVVPTDQRMWALFRALQRGWTVETIHELTKIDPWFLEQFRQIVELRNMAGLGEFREMSTDLLRTLKRAGFADADIALIYDVDESAGAAAPARRGAGARLQAHRHLRGGVRVVHAVHVRHVRAGVRGRSDREEEGHHPRQRPQPHRPGHRVRLLLLPRRLRLPRGRLRDGDGQLQPRDGVDRLRHRRPPLLRAADVRGRDGDRRARAQRRRQRGLRGAVRRPDAAQAGAGAAGGRRRDPRHDARLDRPGRRSAALLAAAVGPRRAAAGERHRVSRDEAREVADRVGYPVVVRPSYVLGGRGMAIVFDQASLDRYMAGAVDVSHDRPVLIDRFLEDAFEFDVDAVADASGAVVIGGIMEHIEEAGIHSGDSSCVVPAFMVAERHLHTIRDYTRRIARALKVVGLMNIQYAIKDDTVYVLEVNPRSSRTVPYISKATGTPMAKIAARVAAGPDARRAEPRGRPDGGRRVREEPGVPVRALPGRRHDPRARDEVHRRGDGRRRQLRLGLRQGDAERRAEAARERLRLHQRQRQRQADRAADRQGPDRRSASRCRPRAAPRRSSSARPRGAR